MVPRRRSGWLALPMLLLLLFPSLGRPAQAGAEVRLWSPLLNLSATPGRSTFPLIQEESPSHDLFVVWTDYSGDPGGEVLLRRRLQATGIWTDTLNLSNSPQRDEGPVLLADSAAGVHLAWSRRDTAQGSAILYRYWDGVAWSSETLLDHTDVYIPSPYGLQFIRDAQGSLCLFVTTGSRVAHTCQSAGQWQPLGTWASVPGAQQIGQLLLGPDGQFHVAVFGQNEGAYWGCDPWLNDVYYATTDGQNWSPLLNLSGQGSIAYDAALAFDAQGRLHVLWSDISPFCSFDSDRSAVYERVLEGGSWSDRSEVSVRNDAQAVEDLALGRDAQGWFYLAWSEGLFDAQGAATDLAIHFRGWWGSGWGPEEVLNGSTDDSLNVDLIPAQMGIVRIVWEKGPTLSEDVYFSERLPFFLFLPLLVHNSAGSSH